MPYKLVLADDHELLLQGITSVLRELSAVEIVALAVNGHEAVTLVTEHRPDLLVLDLNMPQCDGIQTLKKVKALCPQTRVLVLTNYQQPDLVDEIRSLGADGYLVKNSSSLELKEAIEQVLTGGKVFPAAALSPLKDDSPYFDGFLRKYQLTRREVEIIRLVCEGLSSREIAGRLFLSEFTINTHRKNILRKVDSRNIAELIRFAKANLLI